MKLVGTAIAAAGLVVSSTAFAATAQGSEGVSIVAPASQGREAITMQVSTARLDLATPEGALALRKRVRQAIALACNPGDRLDADLSPDFQCRREMAISAEPMLVAVMRAALNR